MLIAKMKATSMKTLTVEPNLIWIFTTLLIKNHPVPRLRKLNQKEKILKELIAFKYAYSAKKNIVIGDL